MKSMKKNRLKSILDQKNRDLEENVIPNFKNQIASLDSKIKNYQNQIEVTINDLENLKAEHNELENFQANQRK